MTSSFVKQRKRFPARSDGQKLAETAEAACGHTNLPVMCLNQDAGPLSFANPSRDDSAYRRTIENYIGTVEVPVGIAGPLKINGGFAAGEYYVPLATTEASLVASYSRGASTMTEAGGCRVALLAEAVDRAPGFAFNDLEEAMRFVDWVSFEEAEIRRVAQSSSAYIKLLDVRPTVEGNHVYLIPIFMWAAALESTK